MSTPPTVAYYTSRMGFHIQAGSDKADYGDIIDALLKTDGASGLVLCTEATKPSTNLFPGMYIKCTDTGKHYYYGGGSFTLGVYSGGTWTEDNYITVVTVTSGNGNMIYGTNSTGLSNACVVGNSSATTVSTLASTTLATVVSPQTVEFDIEIEADCGTSNAGTTTAYSNSISQSQLPTVNLNIDGSDTRIGTLRPWDFGIMGTPASNNVNGMGMARFKASLSIAAAGSHTAYVKISNPSSSFGGVYFTFTLRRVAITALVSVA